MVMLHSGTSVAFSASCTSCGNQSSVEDLLEAGTAGRLRVGHDRDAGALTRPRRGVMELLDVGHHAGRVAGRLQKCGLDLGPLDALFNVVDEDLGDGVLMRFMNTIGRCSYV
jgi:hypothetical protein